MRDEKYSTKIVAASLLGDAYVGYNDTKNANFEIVLTERNKDHLEQIKAALDPIVTSSWYYIQAQEKEIAGKNTTSKAKWRLRTKSHPFFNSFRERMYPNGHKVVDPHYLTLLDWEFLAVWYMQDGCLTGYNAKNKYPQLTMTIATNSFSYADNHYLRIKLKEILNIDCSVVISTTKKGNRTYNLRFANDNIHNVCERMKPFITQSFMYKVDYNSTLARIGARISSGDIVSSVE